MIIRAKVLTNAQDDEYRRVKLSSPDYWDESELIESVNGLYLRPNELVFVDVSQPNSPLILGRSSNWLDMEDLATLLNSLIDMINKTNQTVTKNAQTFNQHTHSGVRAGGSSTMPSVSKQDTISDNDKITHDDITHKQ